MFALGETAIFPAWTADPKIRDNGLAVTVVGGVMIRTGIHLGAVDVEVQALLEATPDVETEHWDEVLDLSVTSEGDLRVTSMADFSYLPLPALTAAGAGDYRLRVHASGRDTNPDGVATEPFEHYLFLAWPAPFANEVIHKATDRFGRAIRARSVAP